MKIRKILCMTAAAAALSSLIVSCNHTKDPKDTAAAPSEDHLTEEMNTTVITAQAADKIFVDPASMAGDGSEANPYPSVGDAQKKIRMMKEAGTLPEGGVDVILKSGVYDITDGLVFGPEDSGSENAPIRYVSEKPHGAILSGGTFLSADTAEKLSDEEKSGINDKAAAEKILKINLAEYGLTADDWGKIYAYGLTNASAYENGVGEQPAEFFCGGMRMTLARYPNEGYVQVYEVNDKGHYYEDIDFTRGPELKAGEIPRGASLTADPDTAAHMSKWSGNDLWIYGYLCYDWHGASYPVSALSENGGFSLAYYATYAPQPGGRYYFFNVFEEINTPGEYYIDRDNGILYFYPPENFENSEMMLTVSLHDLLTINNAEHLTFDGLYIGGSRKNAVTASGSSLTFNNCIIRNVRLNGITVTGTNNTVRNSEISSIGQDGVTMIGGDPATLTKSGNLIYNNYIHHAAESGSGNALSTAGCGSVVSHNEICYIPQNGMSGTALLDVIEYNEIHHTCLDGSDCGAIYSQAGYTNYGGIIRYNYIHDIGTGDSEAMGIYWDDVSSGQNAYGNIIVNTTGYGFMIGGGRDNTCINNIMVNTRKGGIRYDTRALDGTYKNGWWGSWEKNWQFDNLAQSPYQSEIWAEAFPELSKVIADVGSANIKDPYNAVIPANSNISRNIIYCTSGDGIENHIESTVNKFSDVEMNEIIEDGMSDFTDPANGDYTLTDTASVFSLIEGFETIPFSEIGRTAGRE